MQSQEFERTAVEPDQLQPARYFAASYAGEHVAGTEFVIGAMFVSWGVSTLDVLYGLLWGNALAVLTWALVCAPIATDTRLTLYAYLEKIAGRGTIHLYSALNGVLFCILAGAMITVSASAVRILFAIPPQVDWYPTSMSFVAVAIAVGTVVATVAAFGFRSVSQFAEVCAPWMILMFLVGAMALWPLLEARTPIEEGADLGVMLAQVADTHIWRGGGDIGLWHVTAFAWICNLAMHGGLGDMTLLRFARSSRYGYFSALGMFIGHYCAWICAGIMGAGAALLLGTQVTSLDAGAVAYQALGAAGIVAVVIAGWTTSNPTIYRAGMAFQSLNPSWSRIKVTAATGVITTAIACFPFVFTRLLDFVGVMGLLLAPVGAVIVTEHWIFPMLGLTRYWSQYAGNRTNRPAIFAWLFGLFVALILNRAGLHLFFLLLPVWLATTVSYILLATLSGARQPFSQRAAADAEARSVRQAAEAAFLASRRDEESATQRDSAAPLTLMLARLSALGALAACLIFGLAVLLGADHALLRQWLIVPTLVYFLGGVIWARIKESRTATG